MADKKNHGMICIVVMMAKSSSNFCIVLEMYPLHPKQNICKKNDPMYINNRRAARLIDIFHIMSVFCL